MQAPTPPVFISQYTGPGDSAAYNPSSVLAYWSLSEAYSAAKANAAVASADLTRTGGGGGSTTVHVASNGWADAAIDSFCGSANANSCVVTKVYEQSGGGDLDLLKNGAGSGPSIAKINGHWAVKCNGSATNDQLGRTSLTRPTQPDSIMYVIQPNNTTATVFAALGSSNHQMEFQQSAGKFSLFNGARLAGSAFSSGSTYVGGIVGVTSGSGSTITSGTKTSGSSGTNLANTAFGTCGVNGSQATTGNWGHFLIMNNENISTTKITNGYNTEKPKWGAI